LNSHFLSFAQNYNFIAGIKYRDKMNTNSVKFFNEQEVNQVPGESKIILAAWEVKNPSNLGKIIRLGHNLNAEKILFINDDPTYRESKIKKTAGFSFEQASWEILSTEAFFSFIKSNEGQLVVLETCEGAKNIYHEKLPQKMILLAGNESYGLPAEIISISKQKVYIPMPGGCKSMNISQALSVAGFEWYRQQTV
jgi:tRNA G18 (ribose-2'-O)-methylase SpoU